MTFVCHLFFLVLGTQPALSRGADGSETAAPGSAAGETEVAATTEHDSANAPPGPWVVGGFVDTAYQHSSNTPANHVWRGMYTSPRTGEVSLNLAALYVRRDSAPGDPFHMELALQAGAAADALVADEPTPGGVDSRYAGPETWKHLARANVGLSFASGTDVTAGLMVSPIGLGLAWTPWNWHYTTPWPSNAVPYYLAGGRVSQKLGDVVELQAWAVNGWQTLGDINDRPSTIGAVVLTPREDLTVQQFLYFGPETADVSPRAWRVFSNSQVTWNTERFGIAALFDIGRERLPGERAPVALWLATALDLRWRVLAKRNTWDMAARGAGYWDRDGRMFGVPQWLVEAVYTNDVRLVDHALVRLEYRYDHSTAKSGFFYRERATSDAASKLARDQHTIIVALTGTFEWALPQTRSGGR